MSPHLTLIQIADAIQATLSGSIAHVSGISFAEYRLMDAIRQSPGGAATRVQLADAVRLSPSGVSRALKPLEKIGMVENTKAERDARQSLATLTPAGGEILRNCDGSIQATMDSLPEVPITPEALKAYLAELLIPRPRVWKHKENAAFLAR